MTVLSKTVALAHFSRPIAELLADPDVSEISVNRPGEVIIEKGNRRELINIPELTYEHLMMFSHLVATHNQQVLTMGRPLLSGSMPGNERIQIVIPPACSDRHVVLSIRKQSLSKLTLPELRERGFFSRVRKADSVDPIACELNALYASGDIELFLHKAILARKTIIFSGGTNSGKTTTMRAFLDLIPSYERLISIEDSSEIILNHADLAKLFFTRGEKQGVALHTPVELLMACLRLRPDRIIYGELRGAEECYGFLRAINSGHPGSITSIHSDSPRMCFEQLILMVAQAGLNLSRDHLLNYLKSVIDVVVQIKRDSQTGTRYISDVYYDTNDKQVK